MANEIKLHPVEGSSLIAEDGWDEGHTTLRVKFLNGGTYDFTGLSPAIHDAYESASSKGKFLKGSIEKHIKGVRV